MAIINTLKLENVNEVAIPVTTVGSQLLCWPIVGLYELVASRGGGPGGGIRGKFLLIRSKVAA